jgi:hypothetical protein
MPQPSPEAMPANDDTPSEHDTSLHSPSDDPKTSLNSALPSTVRSSPLDPETFQLRLNMLVVAWKEKHPTAKFPIEKVCFLPMNKSPLAAPHPPTTAPRVVHQQDCTLEEECYAPPSTRVRDIQFDCGHLVCNVPINFSLVVSNNLSCFQKEMAVVNALKKVMGFEQNQPTNHQHARHLLFGTFAAVHPQISADHQELTIALARRSLLLEMKAVVESDHPSLGIDFCWFTTSESVIFQLSW